MKPLWVQTLEIESRCIWEATAVPGLVEFDVPVPAHLAQFGATTRASLLGEGDAPLVIVLGGISGNRFPCIRNDGSCGWWPGFTGKGGALDPKDYRILGIDFIADPTGKRAPGFRRCFGAGAGFLCAWFRRRGLSSARACFDRSRGFFRWWRC